MPRKTAPADSLNVLIRQDNLNANLVKAYFADHFGNVALSGAVTKRSQPLFLRDHPKPANEGHLKTGQR